MVITFLVLFLIHRKQTLIKKFSWAFAALAAIESQYLIRKKNVLSLSVQNIIDCNSDFKCGSGLSESAFKYAINNGVNAESTYSYTGTVSFCK